MVAGEPFQWSEFGVLLLLVIGLVPMVVQYRRYRNRWFFTAYLLLTGAVSATNVEAFLLPALSNYVEHGLHLAAAFAYWMTAYKSASAVVDSSLEEALADMPLISHRVNRDG